MSTTAPKSFSFSFEGRGPDDERGPHPQDESPLWGVVLLDETRTHTAASKSFPVVRDAGLETLRVGWFVDAVGPRIYAMYGRDKEVDLRGREVCSEAEARAVLRGLGARFKGDVMVSDIIGPLSAWLLSLAYSWEGNLKDAGTIVSTTGPGSPTPVTAVLDVDGDHRVRLLLPANQASRIKAESSSETLIVEVIEG